jgi:hypothetical protein
MRWAGHVTCMGEVRIGKCTGKRTLGRPMRRWDDNTKLNFKETMGWINLAQNRAHLWAVVNMQMSLRSQ